MKISIEWKESRLLSIFKKEERKQLDNYREISLINTTLEVLTETLKHEIEKQNKQPKNNKAPGKIEAL